MITKFTDQEFSKGTGEAMRATHKGPVFITDQGHPTHVLLSFEEYQLLTGRRRNIADLLAMPGTEAFELALPSRRELGQGADLS